jgi:FlaA1/EpsC-like NDP-sugar epimerase
VQTDFSAAPRFGHTPSWTEILGRESAPRHPILIPGVTGRRVLVTGAGGFIGAELVRTCVASGVSQIVLLETAEQALFSVDQEMSARGYGDRCVPILGSVCDGALLAALFEEHRPEVILHAAALKHVPLMERNPFAAVETNSLGTWLLARIAQEHRVRRMILVSTDKAVAPHSIMGASKRIAELVMLAHPNFTALRLVNVIGSPGSVAPLFAEQIAQAGPVTVTHPAARRFFITLDEVVALVAEAMAADSDRGILVPDPGEPVLIADLARRMIASRDVRIVFTEQRPGDKLEESLISSRERYTVDSSASLRCVSSPAVADLDAQMHALQAAIAARDSPFLLRLVEVLVPDYEPSVVLRDAVLALTAAVPAAFK